jgi:hypothetical protein
VDIVDIMRSVDSRLAGAWVEPLPVLPYRGTSGIDIDLRRVDIDQCPLPAGSAQLNIFAASDKCKKRTTQVRRFLIKQLLGRGEQTSY